MNKNKNELTFEEFKNFLINKNIKIILNKEYEKKFIEKSDFGNTFIKKFPLENFKFEEMEFIEELEILNFNVETIIKIIKYANKNLKNLKKVYIPDNSYFLKEINDELFSILYKNQNNYKFFFNKTLFANIILDDLTEYWKLSNNNKLNLEKMKENKIKLLEEDIDLEINELLKEITRLKKEKTLLQKDKKINQENINKLVVEIDKEKKREKEKREKELNNEINFGF